MENDNPGVTAKFGKQVAQLRREIGWTQEELAERCRASTRTISSIENGVYNLRLETADRLARALGIPLSQILDEVP